MNVLLKKFCSIGFLVFTNFSFLAFGQSNYTVEKLLCGYLENDLELKKIALEAQKAKLNLDSTKIDQGFDIELSTGQIKFYANGDNSVVSVKPSITATIPAAKNISASVSTDYEVNTSKNVNRIQDTKLSVSIDLLSETETIQKINLLKAERELLENNRAVQNAALAAEKSFYTEFSEMLKKINSILTYMQDVYQDQLSFEKIKAQGYSKNSSTYRIAEMKVLTAKHDAETEIRKLKHNVLIFYQHCGITIDVNNEQDLIQFIPSQIPQTNILDIQKFPEEKFSEIEKSKWNNYINQLVRKSDRFFSLGLNTGYTFGNSITKSDSIDAGITTNIAGMGINAGVSFPIGLEDFVPSFSLSATVTPNNFRKRNLTEQKYRLTDEQELIDIQNAKKNYQTALIDFNETLINLDWEKNSVQDSYNIYLQNENDLLKFFNMGIVTESEYLTAKNNRQLYQVKIDLNKIDYLLYNNSVQSLFCDLSDEELESAKK